MPLLRFGEYRPDLSDLNKDFTSSLRNVLPRGDGYGPVKGANVFTSAMAARCRGTFFARNSDGSVTIFAGTEDRLYRLDNTTLTWTDVSKSGSAYSTLSSGHNWTFAQFNSVVIACQANVPPQAYTLGSSSAFADLGGTPPQAAYVSVVNRFLVLSGLLSFPRRVQWSGLDAITTWTSGVTYSDYQDLPDGGNTRPVVGGEFGIILQDTAIRRMVYVPGSPVVFQIDRLARDIGCAAPYSVVDVEGTGYFYSNKGFCAVSTDGQVRFIGREKVDRTFSAEWDDTVPDLTIGAANPQSNLVVWAYRELGTVAENFTTALAYDTLMDRWTRLTLTGQALASFARPGITLESLDTINQVAVSGAADNGSGLIRLTVASTSGWTTGDYKTIAEVGGTTEANGSWTITVINGTTIDLQGSTFANAYTSGGYVAGSLDDLAVSLDDFAASTLSQFAIINTDNKLAFFTGTNLEATLETSEQSGMAQRLFVRGFYPQTDSATVYGCTGRRENLNATPSYTSEALMNAQGFVPQRASTRHARAKLRIPAATEWSYAEGVDPDVVKEGRR